MRRCTFFGHRDCPRSIRSELLKTIKEQIDGGTTEFLVGNHGNFDATALSCLRELKKEYPGISYAVVLAYPPAESDICIADETVFPEGVEFVPKRFAIDFRNRYMLACADTVIAYVVHSYGGAAKYVKYAERKGKNVIWLKSPTPQPKNPEGKSPRE